MTITPGGRLDTSAWTPVEVDGVDALRSPTETGDPGSELGGGPFTTVSVYLPEQDALFSGHLLGLRGSGRRPARRHRRPRRARGRAGLLRPRPRRDRADDAFVERLQTLGLEVELLPQVDKMKRPEGAVISVEPQPGTVVEPGSTVTVTAAR